LCQKLLRSTRLYALLLKCDRDLAEETRQAGCHCGGRLHSARYRRKPAGGPPVPKSLRETQPDCTMQFSFCCDVDGCRERTRPPSMRFLGRRHFLAATVVLISAVACGVTAARLARLREVYDVSRRTLERWRAWWLREFVASEVWEVGRSRFAPSVAEGRLPKAILERFGALGTQAGLLGCLRFFAVLGASDHVRRRVLAGPQNVPNDIRGGVS
jgi:hypothetical protein